MQNVLGVQQMEQIKKRVTIKLNTIIEDNGQKEYYKTNEIGTYVTKGNISVLAFDETIENNENVHNVITIHPNKVTIKRTGAISMTQQFRINQKTESQLTHSFGRMGLETTTKKLKFELLPDQKKGKLVIYYSLKINGQTKRNHQLKLYFKEEEAS